MNVYECLILSYTNDLLRNERMNIGVIVFDKNTRELHHRIIKSPTRLNLVFNEFTDSTLLNLKYSVDELICDIQRSLDTGKTFVEASRLAKYIYPWLAHHDSIAGVCDNIQAVVGECYQRYVE